MNIMHLKDSNAEDQKIKTIELSHYPINSTHWAIPLSRSALPTELSHYPIMLYPLSYPTIP